MITIPTYEEARNRVLSGTYSHLDWFVVEHEPGGVGEEKFRTELANVIDEIVRKCHEEGKGFTIRIDSNEEATQDNQGPNGMFVAATMAISFVVLILFLIVMMRITS